MKPKEARPVWIRGSQQKRRAKRGRERERERERERVIRRAEGAEANGSIRPSKKPCLLPDPKLNLAAYIASRSAAPSPFPHPPPFRGKQFRTWYTLTEAKP
ncbi:hypothetical protein MUK42_37295 [Musa troglodytarum]|uniref:Uncharacterized protein n=1 Tax=Musa troglodytarum TaxID=320322 RepID=A0A9E7ECC8_9LILI|nr:hypothetical protein MUK42_37295 [Musa troglodytarum]